MKYILSFALFLISTSSAAAMEPNILLHNGYRLDLDGHQVQLWFYDDDRTVGEVVGGLVSEEAFGATLVDDATPVKLGQYVPLIGGKVFEVSAIHIPLVQKCGGHDETLGRKPEESECIDSRSIELTRRDSILDKSGYKVVIIEKTQGELVAPLTMSNQKEDWQLRIFFNAPENENVDSYHATISWQAAPFEFGGYDGRNKRLDNCPYMRATVAEGDQLDLPHIGTVKIRQILPADGHHSTWIVFGVQGLAHH